MEQRLIVAGTGLQFSSHGARALEVIPPVRSAPRRLELPGAVDGTKKARSATREQGRTRTGIASLPHVKLSPMSGPGPTGERQEHLDAIVSFAGAGQATGDFPEECRFLLDTQLMFLKKEKDPTSKLLDDDDWIRSLTEAQEITADVREDSVMDHQEVDPKKVRPIQSNGKFLRKYISRRLLALTEGETAALTTAMRQLVVGSQGGGEALAIFHHLLYDE